MTSPAQPRHGASSPAVEQVARRWDEELTWHKRAWRQSQFRWTADHVLDVVTEHTGGQLEFTSTSDLRSLVRAQSSLGRRIHQARVHWASPLTDAVGTLGEWPPVVEALGIGLIEGRSVLWSATGESVTPTMTTAAVVDAIAIRNPLVESWELMQAVRLYEAAARVVEDVLCQLVGELTEGVPFSVLVELTEEFSTRALRERVAEAAAAREAAGGALPIPVQQYPL